MAFTITPSIVSHKLKRVRPFGIIAAILILLFYFSFLNEEYSLNQHLDEEELPRITEDKQHQDINKGKDTEETANVSSEAQANLELLTDHGLIEKNKYFPLLQDEDIGSKIDFTLPDDYFTKQKSIKLREKKKQIRYPIGTENYYKLPKTFEKKEGYPVIQSSYFNDGGLKDEVKLKSIKDAFLNSWSIYKEHGYGHDEVLPLSHKAEDPFNGWSATLVDALDTLILIGEKNEFKDAVNFISKINFKQSYRDDIPLFENTIRILAGLISGYEFSKEKVLLQSAKDLGSLLIEAFDTPNNMPLLYYKWKDELQNRFSSRDACIAEIGSLSLEFSRLTQLTGDQKYFDAITRITKLFEHSFDNFYLPGLYPNKVDATGCRELTSQEINRGVHLNNPNIIKAIKGSKYTYCLKETKFITQNLIQKYSLGGLADSFYEYMPKMYHFLRGNDKYGKDYKDMYLRMIDQVRSYMLFSPKIPDGEELLFVSSISAMKKSNKLVLEQDLDMQHLSCFAGGMFGLGARLFNLTSDMEIAERVTMGCVKMYEKLLIMPEVLKVSKMESPEDVYNETQRLEGFNIPPFVGLTKDDELEAAKKTLSKQLEGAKSETPVSKRGVSTDDSSSEVEIKPVGLPIELVPNVPKIVPSFTYLEDGTRIWQHGKVHNQPIWINTMDAKYILRPEAIESVFYMYRITGDSKWRDYGWMMWENVLKYCKTSPDGTFASLRDITNLNGKDNFVDSLESFWFSETLKYFYLLFDDISVWSLDEYVYNTEAHPFKLN